MADLVGLVAAQLADELGEAAYALEIIATPTQDPGWAEQVRQRCLPLAAALCGDDDRDAAQATIDVMGALWARGGPPPAWWQTPVGRVCARSIGREDAEAVSHSVAAAMLGVHRGTVAQLVSRGRLARHPEGGIRRASVLTRLAEQEGSVR